MICTFESRDILDFYHHVVGKMSGRLYLEYVVIDSWCRILGNELFHGMLIADNDVVPLVEQRIHCCRYYDAEEKEAAYVAEHDASVVGIEKDELYFVHDIDVAVMRATFVVADVVVGMDDYYIDAADTAAAV